MFLGCGSCVALMAPLIATIAAALLWGDGLDRSCRRLQQFSSDAALGLAIVNRVLEGDSQPPLIEKGWLNLDDNPYEPLIQWRQLNRGEFVSPAKPRAIPSPSVQAPQAAHQVWPKPRAQPPARSAAAKFVAVASSTLRFRCVKEPRQKPGNWGGGRRGGEAAGVSGMFDLSSLGSKC